MSRSRALVGLVCSGLVGRDCWRPVFAGDVPDVTACLPCALALKEVISFACVSSEVVWGDDRSAKKLGISCWSPECRVPAGEGPALDPMSELVDDCELCRLGRNGLLLAVAPCATNFLPGEVGFFLLDLAREVAAFDFMRISRPPTEAMLSDELSSSWPSPSLPEPSGEAKRAVGRGPDLESPLDFFKMG